MSASSGDQTGRAGNPLKIVILLGKPSLYYKHLQLVGGLEHDFYFSIYWECHHPNWRTHSFQRGRSTTNQINIVFCSKPCLINEGYTPLQPEIYVIDQLMIIISITIVTGYYDWSWRELYHWIVCNYICIYYRIEIEVVSQYYSSMMEYVYIYIYHNIIRTIVL